MAGFPTATILRPSIVFGPDDNFLNLFGGMIEMLPVLVASRSRLFTATVKADAQFAEEATSSKDWKGKSIVFGD